MAQVPTDAQFRRSRIVVLVGALVLAIAGVVLAAGGSDRAAIVGGFLIGVAAILAIGRVFYEIGVGEDRDRARGRS